MPTDANNRMQSALIKLMLYIHIYFEYISIESIFYILVPGSGVVIVEDSTTILSMAIASSKLLPQYP